jgi:hypothetical protein
MNFSTEVTALTNHTFGATSTPSESDLTSWIQDGAKDIIRRVKITDPMSLHQYATSGIIADRIPLTANVVGMIKVAGNPIKFVSANTLLDGDFVEITGSTAPDLIGIKAKVTEKNTGDFELEGIMVDDFTFNSSDTAVFNAVVPTGTVEKSDFSVPSGIVIDSSYGATDSERSCQNISLNEYLQSKDSDSLYYRSKYYPGLYFDGLNIESSPAPSQSNQNFLNVRYVAYPNIGYNTSPSSVVGFAKDKLNLITIYAAMQTLQSLMALTAMPTDIANLTIYESPPTAPAAPNYSYNDASLEDAIATLITFVNASPPTYNTNNTPIGLSANIESFSQFSNFILGAPDFIGLSLDMPSPGKTLNWTNIAVEDMVEPDLSTLVTGLTSPVYTKPSSDSLIPAWTFYDTPDFSHITMPDITSVLNVPSSSLAFSGITVPTAWTIGGDFEFDWTDFDSALANEDFEEGAAHLTKLAQQVAAKQQEFTHEMDVYNKAVEEKVKLFDYNNEKQWNMELADWNAQIAHYNQQVQDVFTAYQHTLSLETSMWTNVATQNIAKYNSDITNALNKFNAEKAIYDTQVEAITKGVSNELEALSKNLSKTESVETANKLNKYKKDLDQYTIDLSFYDSSVNKYSREIQSKIDAYNADLAGELDMWKTQQANLLTENKNAAQEALNIFNAENAEYQAKLQTAIADTNANSEGLIKKMDVSTNVSIQNKAQELQGEIQKYNAKMDRYVGEVQSYEQAVNKEVAEYAQNIARYQHIQASRQTSYIWMQDQYSRLSSEYEKGFGGAPVAPKAREAA